MEQQRKATPWQDMAGNVHRKCLFCPFKITFNTEIFKLYISGVSEISKFQMCITPFRKIQFNNFRHVRSSSHILISLVNFIKLFGYLSASQLGKAVFFCFSCGYLLASFLYVCSLNWLIKIDWINLSFFC